MNDPFVNILHIFRQSWTKAPNATGSTTVFHSLHEDAPCVCGSNKSAKTCCLSVDGSIRIPPPILSRKGRKYSNPRCYLHATDDCEPTISREHYMSQSVLSLLGSFHVIEGGHWQKERSPLLPTSALGSNILCKAHNSLLSPMDTASARFIGALHAIYNEAQIDSQLDDVSGTWHSGEALERWMVKLSLGLFYSKSARKNGRPLVETQKFNDDLAVQALLDGVWQPNCGLYIKVSDLELPQVDAYAVAPVSNVRKNRFTGCQLYICGMQLMVTFDPEDWDTKYWNDNGWLFRPSQLIFNLERRARVIALTWPPSTAFVRQVFYRTKADHRTSV